MSRLKTLISRLILPSLLGLLSPVAISAPGPLATAPLFLSNNIQPNIFFILDDSGSMNWETLIPFDLVDITDANTRAAALDFSPSDNEEEQEHCSLINVLAYDPNFLYTPWKGVDVNGDPYVDQVATNAVVNPYTGNTLACDISRPNNTGGDVDNTNGTACDLTSQFNFGAGPDTSGAFYYPPEDAAGNTISTFQIGACGTVDNDGDGDVDGGGGDFVDATKRVFISTLGATTSNDPRYPNNTQRNFANWFSYFRKREYVMKRAISEVIDQSTARMGMATINGAAPILGGGEVGTPVKDIDDKTSPVDLVAQANKETLMDNLLRINSTGSTPLRQSLDRAGGYFLNNSTDANNLFDFTPPVDSDSSNGFSPILKESLSGACQQNFAILFSDGFWNGNNPSGINDADGDGDTTFDAGIYGHSATNTLADVAMHFYERDLSSALSDDVPIITGVDEAPHQHLVTYTVSFGLTGSLDPLTDVPGSAGFDWGTPDPNVEQDPSKADDMWHAAFNGRGLFLNADDPGELVSSINNAINDISQRTSSATAATVNSASLEQDTKVYLAEFNTNGWTGDLQSFDIIDPDIGILAATPNWKAGEILDTQDPTTRTILTYDGIKGIPFSVDNGNLFASLPIEIQNDLRTDTTGTVITGTAGETIAKARLQFLRGDRSNEGTGLNFRTRVSVLGDIIHSSPVFIGAPSLRLPDDDPFPSTTGTKYSDYKNGTAADRTPILYTGANDGMLHGFNANNGEEVLAYVPKFLAEDSVADSGYHYLTDPTYLHHYYHDNVPGISDIFLGGSWKTILIGTSRAGGRGMFALDVTDPESFSESAAAAAKTVLWEFTSNDDPDLGFTYSEPVIGLANDGSWVAIFGNGYSNDNDPGSGEAILFIVKIEAGTDGTWDAGDVIKISTGVGSSANRNALAAPALADLDGNGTIDRAYAGDLQGNMWAFDLSGTSSSSWGIPYSSGGTPSPLFTTPANQQITAKPVLAKHPTQSTSTSPSNEPNVMVFFGSGQYLVDGDKSTTNTQSFFGVWDKGGSGLSSDINLAKSDLIEQTFLSGFSGRVLSENAINYATDHGWYFDLDISGERQITTPVAREDVVFFTTFVPEGGVCSVGGFGFLFAVDMVTGSSPENVVIDTNNDGVLDDNDKVTDGTNDAVLSAVKQEGFLPKPVFVEDLVITGEDLTKVKSLSNIPTGRFSWQELIQ